jgi:hypothetical protein
VCVSLQHESLVARTARTRNGLPQALRALSSLGRTGRRLAARTRLRSRIACGVTSTISSAGSADDLALCYQGVVPGAKLREPVPVSEGIDDLEAEIVGTTATEEGMSDDALCRNFGLR